MKKSDYQKELHIRAAIQHLTEVMNDNRIDSQVCYQVIGQLATLGKQLQSKRKNK